MNALQRAIFAATACALANGCSVPDAGDAGVADAMRVVVDVPAAVPDATVGDGAVVIDRTPLCTAPAGMTPGASGVSGLACVGCVTYPATTTATRDVRVHLGDYITNAAVRGVTVTACARSDAPCATPFATGITDGNGAVTLTVPLGDHGFDGVVRVTSNADSDAGAFAGPDAGVDDVQPTLIVLASPIGSGTGVLDASFLVLTPDEVGNVARAGGVTLDATRGHVTFVFEDCALVPASNLAAVLSDADARTQSAYFRSGAPRHGETQTDATGAGAFFNVAAGAHTLASIRAANHQYVGSTSVPVLAGFDTFVVLPPTP